MLAARPARALSVATYLPVLATEGCPRRRRWRRQLGRKPMGFRLLGAAKAHELWRVARPREPEARLRPPPRGRSDLRQRSSYAHVPDAREMGPRAERTYGASWANGRDRAPSTSSSRPRPRRGQAQEQGLTDARTRLAPPERREARASRATRGSRLQSDARLAPPERREARASRATPPERREARRGLLVKVVGANSSRAAFSRWLAFGGVMHPKGYSTSLVDGARYSVIERAITPFVAARRWRRTRLGHGPARRPRAS